MLRSFLCKLPTGFQYLPRGNRINPILWFFDSLKINLKNLITVQAIKTVEWCMWGRGDWNHIRLQQWKKTCPSHITLNHMPALVTNMLKHIHRCGHKCGYGQPTLWASLACFPQKPRNKAMSGIYTNYGFNSLISSR